MTSLEIIACFINGLSVFFAARNNILTWGIGIIGCILFAIMFYQAKLYADVTLQFFFIGTSIFGWIYWVKGGVQGKTAPILNSKLQEIFLFSSVALLGTLAYGALLFYFTDAYSPYWDSAILTFSILAQFLLMKRRIETWFCWLLVNTIAVPLYISRELYITAGLYGIFWFNAFYGFYQWNKALKNETL